MNNANKMDWTTTFSNGILTHHFGRRVSVSYNPNNTEIKVFKDGEIIRTTSGIIKVPDYLNFLYSIAKDAYTLDSFDNSKDEEELERK